MFSSSKLGRVLHMGRVIPAVAAALLVGLGGRAARADVSSWVAVGGGLSWLSQAQEANHQPATLLLEMGVGSPPSAPIIIGGVVKTLTFFGQGTDLAFAVRGATGGFVRGGFGFAIDAGAYQRWWREDSTGFLGSLVLGAPFGLQVTGLYERGSNDVQTFGAILGIDFLRLTVYRTTSTSYWPNPLVPKPPDAR